MSAYDELHALVAEVVEHELATAVVDHLLENGSHWGFLITNRKVYEITEVDHVDNDGETGTWHVYTTPEGDE